MAFDDKTRIRLQNFVSEARTLLTEEFTRQLQNDYGLDPETGEVSDIDSLTFLDDTRRQTAHLLRDILEHYQASSPSSEIGESLERIVREQAFTIFNRLCALRLAEARGYLIESIGNGYNSKGFQLYARVAGTALGETGDAYRNYLFSLFDEFAMDLAVLFDRYSPMGRLFPRESALLNLLDKINETEIVPLWAEDETIGWIYQYFNSKEERKAMRDNSQTPRNTRELAVRNQFFTPRYVVEFLTDNTLGCIWREMRKGNTSLNNECKYLIRRHSEIFLAPGEKPPTVEDSESDLSQEHIFNNPIHIEYRLKKDPRDFRVLDPACGSGHFLLYAFDLLERIYEEAWEDMESPKSEITDCTLREDFENVEDFRRVTPKLIMEHNLHGIDIDPRAVQIAALALWLRAQRTWKRLGIKAGDRPQIDRSNIVTAEPMPGEEGMRQNFTAGLKPKVLGQLVDVVFNKMKLAGEAGMLLKIEEEIHDAVVEAKKQWREGLNHEQRLLFPDMAISRAEHLKLRFDLKGVTDEQFWEQAEGRILESLKEYAELEENGQATRWRLFTEDAARGFAFIDLCRKNYDVVLMNPPFGEVTPRLAEYLARTYPTWNRNILCSFLERGYQFAQQKGAIAAIYDRTAIVKSTYKDFRKTILVADNRLTAMADLGWGVLDANVEVTTSVMHHHPAAQNGVFIDCRRIDPNEKGSKLAVTISNISKGIVQNDTFCESGTSFKHLPNAIVGYDFPAFLRFAFESHPSLEKSGFKANQGLALKAEKHFRLWWEVPPDTRMKTNRLFNGAGYSPYITSLYDTAISAVEPEDLPMDSSTRKSGIGSHRKMGICFGKRGDYFCAHVLPKGHIFTVEGQSIPIANREVALEVLGFINTPLVRYSLNKYCGQHKYSGYVNLLPYCRLPNAEKCRESVELAIDALRDVQRFDEVQSFFSSIPCRNSIADSAKIITKSITLAQKASIEAETQCHSESLHAFNVPESEKEEIESFRLQQPQIKSPIEDVDLSSNCKWFSAHGIISILLGIAFGRWDIRIAMDPMLVPKLPNLFDPLPICPPAMLVGPDGLPAEPGRIVSVEWLHARTDANYIPPEGSVRNPIIPNDEYLFSVSWGGILVNEKGHSEDIIARVREAIEIIWENKAADIEQEACEILGVSCLRDYFSKPAKFFTDHLKRYTKNRRKAPIYLPLSTVSGSYTLWLYYHKLTNQTLYTQKRRVNHLSAL